MNLKQTAAGIALVGAGIIEGLSMGAPCPVCIASVGSGVYTIKKSLE